MNSVASPAASGRRDREGTRAPILVTGSHRSGSTWVGRMIAAAPGVGYVSEPFSVNSPAGVCRADFRHWYSYVDDENAAQFSDAVGRTLGFRYSLGRELADLPANWRGTHARRRAEARTDAAEEPVAAATGERVPAVAPPTYPMPRPVRRMVKDALAFAGHRRAGDVPLMKDPMALFSAPWLARTFDMKVLILVRHPAAFVSSLQRVGWRFPFRDFVEQPLLMRDLLEAFAGEIEEHARWRHDPLDEGALLWRLIHHVIARFRDEHPDWLFVRHEDVSRDPLARFAEIYDAFGLDLTPQARAAIAATSSTANPAEAPGRVVDAMQRDSRANVTTWKSRLSTEQIARIRESTGDVWPAFYSDADW